MLTNQPSRLRICVTSLAGTGENPGPTTNGCSANVLTFDEGMQAATPLEASADDDTSAGTGALKVEINVGTTTKACLPCDEELVLED